MKGRVSSHQLWMKHCHGEWISKCEFNYVKRKIDRWIGAKSPLINLYNICRAQQTVRKRSAVWDYLLRCTKNLVHGGADQDVGVWSLARSLQPNVRHESPSGICRREADQVWQSGAILQISSKFFCIYGRSTLHALPNRQHPVLISTNVFWTGRGYF